jgi:Spy/CpxP family protein refolding chaperone
VVELIAVIEYHCLCRFGAVRDTPVQFEPLRKGNDPALCLLSRLANANHNGLEPRRRLRTPATFKEKTMTRQSKWITGLAVAALSGSLAFAAIGHENAHGWAGHEGKGHQEQMATKLNLTPSQKQQWTDAQKAFFEQNKPFLEQARQTKNDYRAAKKAGDTAKAESIKPTMQSQRTQMKPLRDAQNAKLMSILDDQQKAQFQQMLAQRAQHQHHGGQQK